MNRKEIPEYVKRQLYAESMGRCMNPACQRELFSSHGDIVEKAHIVPYCETGDNSADNLVILCPNCHTEYDKNAAFSIDDLREWKRLRNELLNSQFAKRFESFEALKDIAAPILLENKTIYEHYYLSPNKSIWDKLEYKVLANNKKLKALFENNLSLFQYSENEEYSNYALVTRFLLHVNEFEISRGDSEKIRTVLFPKEIDSMFGVSPVEESPVQSTESLEALMSQLSLRGEFISVHLGIERPYISFLEKGIPQNIFLNDTPRIRQLYHDNNCFRKTKVRLDSLNFALKYLESRSIHYSFIHKNNLREISIAGYSVLFVYEYCISKLFLVELCPSEDIYIVNLHNWNEGSNISNEAYDLADSMNVHLLTLKEYYGFIRKIQ